MNSKLVYTFLFCLLAGLGSVFYITLNNHRKIGYVTTLKVFEEFKLKSELESEYKKTQVVKQSYLDSIKLNIQTLASQNNGKTHNSDETDFEQLKKLYVLKENQFNKENENLYNQYTEQIWKQLNQYMEDFGREKGYDYLLGAAGQGNIMYATEKDNVTKEIIQYVNNKYNGKKSN